MTSQRAIRAATAQRRTEAIRLRLAGTDWQAIADQLGYADRGAACKDVTRALEANLLAQRASGDELREMELMRLDSLQAAAWPKAMQGDVRAIESCLKILDRRAKYLGLDAAIKLEVLTIDALDAQIARLEAELAAAGDAQHAADVGETGQAEASA